MAKITIFLVDPYLINMNDLANAHHGSIIRLRRPAWGRDMMDEAMTEVTLDDDGLYLLQEQGMLKKFVVEYGEKENANEQTG